MVAVRNPHRHALWGFLFLYPPILSAGYTVYPVLAHSISSGVDD